MEEDFDPIDIACVSLRDCLRTLEDVPHGDPARFVLLHTAANALAYLRNAGGGTFSPSELNRVEIGLDLLTTM